MKSNNLLHSEENITDVEEAKNIVLQMIKDGIITNADSQIQEVKTVRGTFVFMVDYELNTATPL